MNRFSRTVMVGARLSSARLLETKPTRLAMASRGRGASSGAPPSATRPAVRATSPNSTRPTVSWPAPRSPTSPPISPAATVKETGPTSPATSPSTASMVPAVPAGGLTNSSDSERPTMWWTRAAGLVPATESVVTRRPSRSTVTRSAMRKTSSSRWVT